MRDHTGLVPRASPAAKPSEGWLERGQERGQERGVGELGVTQCQGEEERTRENMKESYNDREILKAPCKFRERVG